MQALATGGLAGRKGATQGDEADWAERGTWLQPRVWRGEQEKRYILMNADLRGAGLARKLRGKHCGSPNLRI